MQPVSRPVQPRRARQRQPLAQNFVDHDDLRVFPAGFPRYNARRPDGREQRRHESSGKGERP